MRSPAPWLFALIYGLHLLEEGLLPPGMVRWSNDFGYSFSFEHWFVVSSASFVLFSGASWLVARGSWPSWVLVALATHIGLHGLLHLGASVWVRSVSPGTLTGILLALPLSVWTFRWALQELDRKLLLRSALLGAATFQAPWDLMIRLAFGLEIWVE